MNIFRRARSLLLRWWGWEARPSQGDWGDHALIEIDDELHASLKKMARQKRCSEGELVMDLIQDALEQKEAQENASLELMERWQNLTFREQQVVTLIGQGFTNRQVAAQLNISPETVKVYVRQAFGKLGFHSRKELRTSLFA